jgi:hypothetical protein
MSALEDVMVAVQAAVARLEDAAAAVAEVLAETDTALDVAAAADVPAAIQVLTELKDEGEQLGGQLADGQAALEGYVNRIQAVVDDL